MVLHRGTEGRSVMKAAFHTLGCKVNQYETEAVKEAFVSRGAEIVGEEESADVYVVNTCTVILPHHGEGGFLRPADGIGRQKQRDRKSVV